MSYEWEPEDFREKNPESITVGGHKVEIKYNLFLMLESLRHLDHGSAKFWTHAICIDQHNITERNHQVMVMSRIYSSATIVWCWLRP